MKIVDLSDLYAGTRDRYIDHIREFSDYYEFCLIDDYELKYDNCEINSIEMKNTHAVTLETNDKFLIAGILFYKKQFNLNEILDWLETYCISYIEKDKNQVKDVGEIIMGIRFKGRTIILYTKGSKQVGFYSDDFIEITQNYNFYRERVDTTKSKDIHNKERGLVVYLNDEKLDFIPVLEFNMSSDFIIVNGNVVEADYIKPYRDNTIGFFSKDDLHKPVSYIADNETDVYIETYETEYGADICYVEYRYIVDPYKLSKD